MDCRYRNPSPPPGYIEQTTPQIKLKEPHRLIEGLTCEFLGLIVESRILNALSQPSDIEIGDSDNEEPLPIVTEATSQTNESNKETTIQTKNSNKETTIQTKESNKETTSQTKESNMEEFQELSATEVITEKSNEVADKEELVELLVEKETPPIISIIDLTEDVDSQDNEFNLEKASNKSHASKDVLSNKKKKMIRTKSTKSSLNLVYNYSSDSSSNSSSTYTSKKKKRDPKNKRLKSPSPKSENNNLNICGEKYPKGDFDYSVKEELPDKIRGIYYCKICKASMNNECAYQSHMKGKRHFKAFKAHNISKAIEDSIQALPTPILSRYRLPPPNVYRIQTGDTAESQKVIEKEVRSPCPGLDKVIEIQGLQETHYYCRLCDAPCNAGSIIYHLRGYPHQLQCLKYFDPDTYKSIVSVEKHFAKDKVTEILAKIESNLGCGQLVVEKEFLNPPSNLSCPISRVENMPGPSYQDPIATFEKSYTQTVVPDSSRPDFYCSVCDSHMNNKIMWESHIRGKRHIKNCNKAPGVAPSKVKAVLVPNAPSFLMANLEQIWKPVVGLDHIRETQKPEVAGAIYNCFLCGACCGGEDDIVDHILTQKHRIKYLEKIGHPDMALLNEMTMSESRMCGIVENICAQVEAEIGRGNIEVYVSKKSTPMW